MLVLVISVILMVLKDSLIFLVAFSFFFFLFVVFMTVFYFIFLVSGIGRAYAVLCK